MQIQPKRNGFICGKRRFSERSLYACIVYIAVQKDLNRSNLIITFFRLTNAFVFAILPRFFGGNGLLLLDSVSQSIERQLNSNWQRWCLSGQTATTDDCKWDRMHTVAITIVSLINLTVGERLYRSTLRPPPSAEGTMHRNDSIAIIETVRLFCN